MPKTTLPATALRTSGRRLLGHRSPGTPGSAITTRYLNRCLPQTRSRTSARTARSQASFVGEKIAGGAQCSIAVMLKLTVEEIPSRQRRRSLAAEQFGRVEDSRVRSRGHSSPADAFRWPFLGGKCTVGMGVAALFRKGRTSSIPSEESAVRLDGFELKDKGCDTRESSRCTCESSRADRFV